MKKKEKTTMTLEQRQDKECLSKKKLTVAEAQMIIRQEKRNGLSLYFYECDFCGGVHLTRGKG